MEILVLLLVFVEIYSMEAYKIFFFCLLLWEFRSSERNVKYFEVDRELLHVLSKDQRFLVGLFESVQVYAFHCLPADLTDLLLVENSW